MLIKPEQIVQDRPSLLWRAHRWIDCQDHVKVGIGALNPAQLEAVFLVALEFPALGFAIEDVGVPVAIDERERNAREIVLLPFAPSGAGLRRCPVDRSS